MMANKVEMPNEAGVICELLLLLKILLVEFSRTKLLIKLPMDVIEFVVVLFSMFVLI